MRSEFLKDYYILENNIKYHVYEFVDRKCYYNDSNGFLSRENGPAIEFTRDYGDNSYYFNSHLYPNIKTNQEWQKLLNELIIKDIIE